MTVLFASTILWFLLGSNMVGPWRVEGQQVPGYAEIAQPSPGAVVTGLVTIQGTAFHPEFLQYDLSFAYPEDPSQTWFFIGEPTETPVHDGRLGIWDTSGVTEGEYDLRLRVWTAGEDPLVAMVAGVRVSETAPAAVPPTPPQLGQAALDPTRTVSPPSTPTLEPAAAPARSDRAPKAFGWGIVAGTGALAALGSYGWIRGRRRSGPRPLRRRPRRGSPPLP